MNKRGLANGLIAIFSLLLVFAFVSAIVIPIGSKWQEAINNIPSDIVDDYTKEQIISNTNQLSWVDKAFTLFLIALLISYLVTSFTLPVKSAWIFLLFVGFLVVVSFVAMIFSNSWTFMLSDPFFDGVTDSIPITDFVLRNFPYFIFLVGVVGGVVFYGRSREDNGIVGSPPAGGFGGQEF